MRALVVRGDESREIDVGEVVPGDIALLESGNRVPADLRLISTVRLQVDESLLTGESQSVGKDASWLGTERTPLAERSNMAYAGSVVVRGRARGVVVATGATTEVGRLAVDVMAHRVLCDPRSGHTRGAEETAWIVREIVEQVPVPL